MRSHPLCALIDNTLNVNSVAVDLTGWLVANAADCDYLLAHAEDGVVWGRLDGGQIIIAGEVPPARLDAAILWQCRMFGPDAEVLLWRSEGVWHARKITDVHDTQRLALDETQMLWGTKGTPSTKQHFTVLEDGAEGLRHAVPIPIAADCFDNKANPRPARLLVRHYLEEDPQTGVSRIFLSRLVDVTRII